MSHKINFTIYDEKVNKQRVQKEWNCCAALDDWQEGCSGLPGQIEWKDIVFDNCDAAREYIEKHDDGNYRQIAVKFRDYSELKVSKKEKELKEKVEKCRVSYYEKKKYAFANNKSAFRTCPKCDSKISLKYLKTNNCPVCGFDMRSDTVKKSEQSAYVKWQNALEEYNNEKNKPRNGGKIKWLLKTEYHV